ncbi:MAG: leucine-rich repeat protein [Muribaculaceae bacterium]|nr:leucine-rich repeat protein [Muribaculaceae bacterium]
MRKLNLTLRTILLILILISTATTTYAYSFVVNGIYYNINGDEATVTYKSFGYYNSSGRWIEDYMNDNSGDVVIPETVTYNGTSYTVTAIGDHAFYNKRDVDIITSISLPNTITTIGDYAFYNCWGLNNIAIPDSVMSIGAYAFCDCDGLSYVTIPNSIVSIGNQAFYHCSNLKTILIGSSVITIGASAFLSCPLSSITCLATTPPEAENLPNTNTAKLCVPKESVELYRTTYPWNYFTNVYGFGNDSFSVPVNTAFHGDTIVIPVSMQNESSITAFQTDVYLPEGFEFVQNNGEYQVSLSDRKGRDHVIMVSDAPDGALRVLSYSPSLKPFKNNEGELFYITVKVPEGISGTYPIWLRNTILTSTDEEELYAIDALSNVMVTNIIKGDANADGSVTVTDVVWAAKYILFQNPEPFVFEAADMNDDGKITITDVVKIANLVLDQDYDEPTNLHMMAHNMGGDRMSGEAVGNTICINLANEMEYTAMQMDLTLPEGLTASKFALTNRTGELDLIVKDRGNGKVRVLAYSPNLKTIKGNGGAVLTFNVDGTMGDIIVDRIELVNLEGKAVRINAFSITANNPTALNEMNACKAVVNVKYFNLAGQQMTKLTDGVNLVVTTYSDGTRTTRKVIR